MPHACFSSIARLFMSIVFREQVVLRFFKSMYLRLVCSERLIIINFESRNMLSCNICILFMRTMSSYRLESGITPHDFTPKNTSLHRRRSFTMFLPTTPFNNLTAWMYERVDLHNRDKLKRPVRVNLMDRPVKLKGQPA